MKGTSRAALLAVIALFLSSTPTARATDGNLPGGTPISVNITAPSSGTGTPVPPGEVTLRGTATVDVGVPAPSILLVYVLDVSISTGPPLFLALALPPSGCANGATGTVLDCEIAVALALNGQAVASRRVGLVGALAFAVTAVAGNVGTQQNPQAFTGPNTDVQGLTRPDVEEVLESAFTNDPLQGTFQGGFRQFTRESVVAVSTSFAAALSKAAEIINATPAPPGIKTRIIVFMSDGAANIGSLASVNTLPSDVVIKAFAIGSAANCDSDPLGGGSLAAVAALGARPGQDSVCRHVASVADVRDVVLPEIFGTKLNRLLLSVDGQSNVDISDRAVPVLPPSGLAGPVSVTFEHAVRPGLGPGRHELCVAAEGIDVGGIDVVRDCLVLGTLQVAWSGDGEGTVRIASAGGGSEITCNATCPTLSTLYPVGSVVRLTATPASGSIFTGWIVGDCPGVLDCDVTVRESTTTVFAVFRRELTLILTKSEGSRFGTVASEPPGITCPPRCPSVRASFVAGSTVTLTATPEPDATFAGWTPPTCAGTGPCVIVLNQDRSVGAYFGTPDEAFVAGLYQNVQEVTPFSPAINPSLEFLKANRTPEAASAFRDAVLALDRRFRPGGRLRTLTPASYVAAFYRAILGREFESPDERAAAIAELFRPVVQIFVDSAEFKNRTLENIVTSLYQGFLGRAPTGQNGSLAAGGDFVGEALQILGSPEFLDRSTTSILDLVSETFYRALLGRARGAADPSPSQWEQTLLGLKQPIEAGLIRLTDAEFQDRFQRLFTPGQ